MVNMKKVFYLVIICLLTITLFGCNSTKTFKCSGFSIELDKSYKSEKLVPYEIYVSNGKTFFASIKDEKSALEGTEYDFDSMTLEEYKTYFCENNKDSISAAINKIAETPDLHIQSNPVEAFSAKRVAQSIIQRVYG